MTEDDFLKAAIANPDDDTPRLVYADWLDDRGDAARAEAIRLDCRQSAGLSRRESERLKALIQSTAVSWKLPGIPGVQAFDRGFVGGVKMSAEEFLKHADRLSRTAPIVRVSLVVAQHRVGRLAGVPWLRRVQALDLSNNDLGSRSRLAEFFSGPPWPNLRTLVLRNNGLFPDSCSALTAAAAGMPALRHLDLSGNPFSDDGVAALSTANPFASLEELVFRCDMVQYPDAVHAEGVARVARSRTLHRLRRLDLTGQYAGDAGLSELAGSPNSRELVELVLRENKIGADDPDAGIVAVVRSPYLGNLKRLDLSRNWIGPAGLRALLDWQHLPEVEWIDLGERGWSAAGNPPGHLEALREESVAVVGASRHRDKFRV